MKLIDEKEVEGISDAFRCGVIFAEQKLQPMMVEFAEWCSKGYLLDMDSMKWSGRLMSDVEEFTTEQLLEQFLKTKQK